MDDATPSPRTCTVCGRPLQRGNQSGICSGDSSTPACKSARSKAAKRKRKSRVVPDSERKACAICGGKLRADNKVGVCRRTPECRAEIASRRWANGRRAPVIPAGTVFGRWTTLEENPPGTRSKTLCRCECGTERYVYTDALRRGTSRSCGCLKHESKGRYPSDGPYLPAGSVSGSLTTLEDAADSRARVPVRCECGRVTDRNAQRLKAAQVQTCGCRKNTARTHGLSGHPLYDIWRSIVSRCTNPASRDYWKYGAIGRGICAGWTGMPDGFLRFAADMGERPSREHSVDRWPDNSGGYWCGRCEECTRLGRPANFRWATDAEQGANKTTAQDLVRVTCERDAALARMAELEGEVVLLRAMLADERGALF
jgi:hypothetical protein